MKTKILSIVAFALFATNVNAQTKNSETKIRRGFINLLVNVDGFKEFIIPPLMLTTETVFDNTYSLEAGLGNLSYASSETFGIKTNVFSMGVYIGGNYYFNKLLKLDMDKYTLSGGVGLMYSSATVTVTGDNEYVDDSTGSTSDFSIGANVKGRYFFTPKLAVIAQANFGKGDTAIFAGLSYRLK